MNRSSLTKNFEDALTVSLFLGLIIGLSAISIFSFFQPASKILTQENRLPAELPKLQANIKSIQQATVQFDKYFTDRFAFRTDLVSKRNALLVSALGVSPSNGVLIGKNEWLYYMLDGDADTLRHARLFSTQDLAAWKNALEEQSAWLARRGIKYAFVLAPSKCSVYRENVPEAYTLLNPRSRADQLVSFLKEHSSVDVIDLRQPLLDRKSIGQLYYRTDTHWNKLGAMLASTIVINHVREKFPNLKESRGDQDYTISLKPVEHGDLVRLMGVDGLLSETQPVLSRRGGEGWKLSHNPPPPTKGDPRDAYKPLATQNVPLDTKAPRIVLIGDSFSVPLVAYLAPSFNRIYLDRDTKDKPEGRFSVETIEKEKPDMVLQEITERKLMLPAPKNPPELCQQLSQAKGNLF